MDKKQPDPDSLFRFPDPDHGNDDETVEIEYTDESDDDEEEQTVESYRAQIILCPGCNKPVASTQKNCLKCGSSINP